jgi:hypothetical protein
MVPLPLIILLSLAELLLGVIVASLRAIIPLKNCTIGLNVGNGPHVLMHAPAPPPPIVPPLPMVPLPLIILLSLAELLLGVIVASLGAIIPLMIET